VRRELNTLKVTVEPMYLSLQGYSFLLYQLFLVDFGVLRFAQLLSQFLKCLFVRFCYCDCVWAPVSKKLKDIDLHLLRDKDSRDDESTCIKLARDTLGYLFYSQERSAIRSNPVSRLSILVISFSIAVLASCTELIAAGFELDRAYVSRSVRT
jgi:hypothetical protein